MAGGVRGGRARSAAANDCWNAGSSVKALKLVERSTGVNRFPVSAAVGLRPARGGGSIKRVQRSL